MPDVVLWPGEDNPADVVLRPAGIPRTVTASATALVSAAVTVEVLRAKPPAPTPRWVLPSFPEPRRQPVTHRLRVRVEARTIATAVLMVDNPNRRRRDDEDIELLLLAGAL